MICTNQKCDRRSFLVKSMKLSAAVCISYSMPAMISSCSLNQDNKETPENYYISRKLKLLKDFDKVLEAGKKVLVKSLGKSEAVKFITDARREYEAIISEIPYIGGDENGNSTFQLIGSAQCLALYRILILNRKNVKESGQIIYDAYKAFLQSFDKSLPASLVSIFGYFRFHVGWAKKIKRYSEMSLKRKYPMDFVYTFIEGDGKNLDYGNDMYECAIQKFLKKQDAEEILPYLCALDYPISERFNRGLIRTKTLVESDMCDFRYRRNQKTQINLPPGLKVW